MPKKITETYLHNAGLYYLQRFAASREQFRTVMTRKIDRSCRHHADQDRQGCIGMLDNLILRFTESGLLNDENYARGMVISLRRRGMSERAITMKLKSRGIHAERISAALDDFDVENLRSAGESDLQAALRLAQRKKYGPYADGRDVPYEKAMAAFARAGFSFEIARRVLAMAKEEAGV